MTALTQLEPTTATDELTRWLGAVASGMADILASMGLEVSGPSGGPAPIPDHPGSHISLETTTESFLVGLAAPEESLWRVACAFMGLPDDEPFDRTMHIDATCELANILAGNLRDMLLPDEPGVLVGLPTYVGGALHPTGTILRGALPLTVMGVELYVVAQRYALPPARLEFLRMTAELRNREARLQAILNAAVDGVLTIDDQGRVESCNPAGQALFGLEQVVGVDFRTLVPTWAPGPNPSRSGDLHNQDPSNDRVAIRRGNSFPIELTSTAFTRNDRTMYAVFARDLTERRRAEAQLRHAQKLEAIGQLAAGIAHEINTPLQFVGDNTRFVQQASDELLKLARTLAPVANGAPVDAGDLKHILQKVDVEFLAEEVPRALDETLDGITRVADIVSAMKAFARSDGNQRTAVDINVVVETSVKVCRNEWKDVAELELELTPDLPMLDGYRSQLHQVILNLVVNAAHAIHDARRGAGPGRIVVRTRFVDEAVEIQVEDNGSGIPEAARSRVFDPFFTTKDVGRGTGQGLSIVWSAVVDAHHGHVRFDTASGVGTTFFVRLPLAAGAPL
ncbi:MAG: PAS domain S-box protein [Deltaproteobacteria bacterium]|nr:PAS domain S-box protein [Deltaproteobacteria bacterium]